jgi:hypothetical protein
MHEKPADRMRRSMTLVTSLALVLFFGLGRARAAEKPSPPNIVVILADDKDDVSGSFIATCGKEATFLPFFGLTNYGRIRTIEVD